MKKSIWNVLFYGNVPRKFYKENRELLDKTNYISVKMAYAFSTFLFVALSLVAILYPEVKKTFEIYLVMAVLCGIVTVVVFVWLPKHLRWTKAFYVLFEVVGFGTAITAGTYFSKHDLAVLFFVLLVVLPLLYVERPIYSVLVSVVASILFGIMTYLIKGVGTYHVWIDLLNTFFCLVISVVFIYYVRNMHLTYIQASMNLLIQSEVDGLTGLLNKTSTEKACQNYLAMNAEKQNCAILVLDIDEFKQVNDTLGHKQGDMLLRQIGHILQGIFREEDVVGRIGGDEFMVLLKNVHDVKVAEIKAGKIIEEVANIFADYSTRHFGCSIGIANNNMQGLTFPELYSMADHALYQAKENGKGRYVVFSEENVIQNKDLPTMLVVDDIEVSRAVLRTCFEEEFNILEADNGKKALDLIEKYCMQIDVMLLDLEMPVLNGYEVLKYVKGNEKFDHIRILIITANDKNELLALELGADDLISKPYDPLVVKKRVANAMAK